MSDSAEFGILWGVSIDPAGWRKEIGGSRCGELVAGGRGGASGRYEIAGPSSALPETPNPETDGAKRGDVDCTGETIGFCVGYDIAFGVANTGGDITLAGNCDEF